MSKNHFQFTDGVFKVQYGPTTVGDQLVEEFMTETQQAVAAAPQAFRMDSLLQVTWNHLFKHVSILFTLNE